MILGASDPPFLIMFEREAGARMAGESVPNKIFITEFVSKSSRVEALAAAAAYLPPSVEYTIAGAVK